MQTRVVGITDKIHPYIQFSSNRVSMKSVGMLSSLLLLFRGVAREGHGAFSPLSSKTYELGYLR